MLKTNIQFFPMLEELESTFLSPLQATNTKVLTDARKSFQLLLLQIVQLRFSGVETGSQEFHISDHNSKYMHIPRKQIKVIQGMEEVPFSTST